MEDRNRDESLMLTSDSFLLAATAAARIDARRVSVCDLGCGSGAISVVLAHRCPAVSVTGVDISESLCKMYRENSVREGLADRMTAVCASVEDLRAAFPPCRFDTVITNPPYFAPERGDSAADPLRRTARMGCPPDVWLAGASYLLKPGGSVYLCFPAARASELLCAMTAAKLEPKYLRAVAHSSAHAPSLVLVTGRKNGAPGLTWAHALIQYGADGQMTPECAALYDPDGKER